MGIEVGWFAILLILALLIYQEYTKYACKQSNSQYQDTYTHTEGNHLCTPPIIRHDDRGRINATFNIETPIPDRAPVHMSEDDTLSQYAHVKEECTMSMPDPDPVPVDRVIKEDRRGKQDRIRYVPLRERVDHFKKERLDTTDPTIIDIDTHRRNMSNVLSWGLKQDASMVHCST